MKGRGKAGKGWWESQKERRRENGSMNEWDEWDQTDEYTFEILGSRS